MNANDFLKKIDEDKSNNIPLLGKNFMSNIHNRIINKVKRVDNYNNPGNSSSNQKAQDVMRADSVVRNSIKELAESLFNLGDKDIAMKLLAEHIMMLNEIFKNFE